MSGYRGRTGPNFTQYLSNLNALSPPYDPDSFLGDDLNGDDNLDLFTNVHFDLHSLPENGPVDFDLGGGKAIIPTDAEDMKYEDLLAGAVSSPSLSTELADFATDAHSNEVFHDHSLSVPAAPQSNSYPVNINQTLPAAPSSIASPQAMTSQSASLKRKSNSTLPSQISAEEQSRLAAEEDKRRRNTAASARFRVKKKQREQTLEKTVKEISDKNAILEAKISQLETENKWLKNLITEKNGNQSNEDIAEAYQQFRRDSEERETAKDAEHKDGVGTRP